MIYQQFGYINNLGSHMFNITLFIHYVGPVDKIVMYF